jgi:nitroreductase
MDVLEAIRTRRSCRSFRPDPIPEEDLKTIIEAATWAPSPLNAQPWEFIVVTSQAVKERIFQEADQRRRWLLEKSGWKWLGKYSVDFLKVAPAIVAVIADPEKTGADRFLEGGGIGYQHGCCAAVQNMLLAAHAMGYGGLWFTLYDMDEMRGILDVSPPKEVLALVCLGKAEGEPLQTPRKGLEEKTRCL